MYQERHNPDKYIIFIDRIRKTLCEFFLDNPVPSELAMLSGQEKIKRERLYAYA